MKTLLSLTFTVFFIAFHIPLWAVDKTDPRYEQRQYRRFILPNQLKVFLISDPTVHHGAASLSVGVGSLSDPPTRQGLAHFLEHMLFLGTKKYPGVDDEKKFLTRHDGSSNAFTSDETTNYHFQVASDYFQEGLDRFSQFFIAPLFTPEYVERELKAVDSEYSQKRPSDYWRISQVESSFYEPNHPAQKFRIGNLVTLQGTSRTELLEFYNNYYSANLMTLAVLGKQDLDTLEKWVIESFGAIRNLELPLVKATQTYLKKSEQFRVVKIEPLKDTRILKLTFPLPSLRHLFQTKPTHALGHLIGHEGKGSLLSLLKKEGLATALSAGGSSGRSYGRFGIRIQLTAKGLKNYKTVIYHVFQYIRLLRRTGYQKELYHELKRMAEIDYRFQEKEEGTGVVIGFASLMHFIPLPLLETAPFLYEQYDAHHFDSVLYRLTPENMFVTLVAKGFKVAKKEPFFGAKYTYTENDAVFLKRLQRAQPHPAMKLPEKNIFIPEKLQLVSLSTSFALTYQSLVGLRQEQIPQPILEILANHQYEQWESWEAFQHNVFPNQANIIAPFRKLIFKHATAQPEQLLNNAQGEIWFQQDLRFATPKAQLTFLIHTPEVYRSARTAVLSQLYASAIEEGLNEFGYAVHIAGLEFGLGNGKKGITLSISGYSDRILTLSKALSTKLKEITIDEGTFESLKERRLRRYQNFQFNQPYQQALYIQSLLMEEKKHSIAQYQQEIETVTLAELQAYTQTLYQKTYVQGVVYGNLEKSAAKEAVVVILKNLSGQPLPKSDLFENTIVQIQNPDDFVYSKKVKVNNSALVLDIQVGQTNPRLRAAMLIIANALRSWAYTELRTQQQLGYTVFGDLSRMEKMLGWMVLVQSGNYSPGVLQERVEAYLPKFVEDFKNLSETEFENFRKAVLNSQLEKSSSLSGEADFLFYRAFEKEADFDYVSTNIKAIENMTRAEVIEVLKETLAPGQKPSLAIRMVGNAHQDTPISGKLIETYDQFKSLQTSP